jgi:carbon storage regulator
MLVLSRKIGEKIYVGAEGPDQVCVTIVDICRDKVRVGIEARKEIPIYRQELRPFDPLRIAPTPTDLAPQS